MGFWQGTLLTRHARTVLASMENTLSRKPVHNNLKKSFTTRIPLKHNPLTAKPAPKPPSATPNSLTRHAKFQSGKRLIHWLIPTFISRPGNVD